MSKPCPACKGKLRCFACSGEGKVSAWGGLAKKNCPACRGSKACPTCKGSGRVR
jgi:hypothetical protein